MPAFQFYLFLIAIGAIPNDLKLGVVNHENHNCRHFTVNSSLPADQCAGASFSCEFISHIANGSFDHVFYDSRQLAVGDFKNSKIFGIIEIPENFTRIIFDESEGQRGAVDVLLDNSKYSFLFPVKAKMITGFLDFMDSLASRCHVNEILRARPIKVKELFGTMNFDIRTTLMTAIMLSLSTFFLAMVPCVVQ
jgi:hypothetical protein